MLLGAHGDCLDFDELVWVAEDGDAEQGAGGVVVAECDMYDVPGADEVAWSDDAT